MDVFRPNIDRQNTGESYSQAIRNRPCRASARPSEMHQFHLRKMAPPSPVPPPNDGQSQTNSSAETPPIAPENYQTDIRKPSCHPRPTGRKLPSARPNTVGQLDRNRTKPNQTEEGKRAPEMSEANSWRHPILHTSDVVHRVGQTARQRSNTGPSKA